MKYSSDIAFSDSVKKVQARKGSRETYQKHADSVGYYPEITAAIEAFIAEQNSVFLATVNASGQPYIQHRGGPKGFIKVIDSKTLAFADYKGNRQFITTGNLLDNRKAFLMMVDYVNRDRIKFWGTVEVIDNDPALLDSLMPDTADYRALPEQVLRFSMTAWDRNCPAHIPARMDVNQYNSEMKRKDDEIARLQMLLDKQH